MQHELAQPQSQRQFLAFGSRWACRMLQLLLLLALVAVAAVAVVLFEGIVAAVATATSAGIPLSLPPISYSIQNICCRCFCCCCRCRCCRCCADVADVAWCCLMLPCNRTRGQLANIWHWPAENSMAGLSFAIFPFQSRSAEKEKV